MISPVDLGFLWGTAKGVNKINKKNINFAHIVYSSMIMCGVNKIYSMSDGLPESVKPPISSTLIKCDPPKGKIAEWLHIYDHITNMLKQYNNNADPIRLASFLANLIYSLNNHTAFTTPYGFDEMAQKLSFCAEIDIPLNIFVQRSMESSRVSLPNIRTDIEKDDIYRLTDVLHSKIYQNYIEAHQEIEEGADFSAACKSIVATGDDLINANKALLVKNNNTLIGGIGIFSEIIETFLGKLFQKGFDVFLSAPIKNALRDYRRIPMYSYGTITNDLMIMEVKEWIHNNPTVFEHE